MDPELVAALKQSGINQDKLSTEGYTGPPVTEWDLQSCIRAAAELPKITDFGQ